MRGGLCLLMGTMFTQVLAAQDVRITGSSWLQSIDLRPLRRDSVLQTQTTETGGVVRGPDGVLVSCLEGSAWCTFLGSAPRATTRPLLHDIGVAAWGLGEGVSLHAHGRIRGALGASDVAWPRVNDRFDLLDAYLEVDRPRVRVRLGRQWSLGGLGAYNYDGAALTLRRSWVDADAFGGRALVQGLNEPYTSAEIGVVDDLPPETAAWLMGVRVRARPSATLALTGTWIRVLQDDRSGLYAERVALDASWRVLGTRVTANLAGDVASTVLNEAHLQASRPVGRGVDLMIDVRQSRPFFELWTIWGAFAPIGFAEGRAGVTWASSDGTRRVALSGARRQYGDAGTGLQSVPLRNDGWRVATEGSLELSPALLVSGSYGADVGFGSAQSDGLLGLTWSAARWEFGATASAVQTIYEFRVGTGRVLGAAVQGAWRLTSDLRLRADWGQYQHRLTNDAPGRDWSQRRASVRVEWAVGADPGAVR